MLGPDPDCKYPFESLNYEYVDKKDTVFIKNIVTRKNIIAGEYSYFNDRNGAKDFENKNVLYHYPSSKEHLIIKKFVAIAANTKFIMSPSNHKINGFSTYPFAVFQQGWEKMMDISSSFPSKGDTVVGNDVWICYGATIMPGITIGNGAIIATKAVVTKDVAPYSICWR